MFPLIVDPGIPVSRITAGPIVAQSALADSVRYAHPDTGLEHSSRLCNPLATVVSSGHFTQTRAGSN
jgi:hypothetical protein